MKAIYHDGSGNGYYIQSEELDYKPMKPTFSSSGIYDGGEARKIQLSEEQIKQLEGVFLEAFDDTSAHIDNRLMGSGQLSYQGKTIRLSIRSEAKRNIEKMLNSFMDE